MISLEVHILDTHTHIYIYIYIDDVYIMYIYITFKYFCEKWTTAKPQIAVILHFFEKFNEFPKYFQ